MRTSLLLACLLASWVVGCGFEACDCATPGARLDVAQAAQGHVVATRVSGSACDGYTPECLDESGLEAPADRCSFYRVNPGRPGACHFEVDFDDGTAFKTDFELARRDEGCCSGNIYVLGDLPSIEITKPSSPVDAGAD